MALVLVPGTKIADELLVCQAVDLHQLVVLRAHLLLQWDCGRHQPVLPQHGDAVVRLEVGRTERRQTRQARHCGFVGFGSAAEITDKISKVTTDHSSWGRWLHVRLQLFHKLGMTGRS